MLFPFFGITPTLPFDQPAPSLKVQGFSIGVVEGGFRVMLWYAINGRFVAE
jgi:hypothetical protein